MRTPVLLLTFVVLAGTAALSAVGAAPVVSNGAMEGTAVDHSAGKALLVTPPGWTPVNVNTDRGDRLAVQASDRPGAGQCLHVTTLGSDAGVYQTIAPLETGRSYLVSAWVKRLSGTLNIEAYSYAWGPAIMRRLDGRTSGWVQITVGLTAVDGGAHLYLVAAPEADFLIDDVQLRPAAVRVGAPEPLPYDFTNHWRYRASVALVPGAPAPPSEVSVQAVSDRVPGRSYGPARRVSLRGASPGAVELPVPTSAEGSFCVEVRDPGTGEVLGGSPVLPLPGSPWVVRYPHKDALYSSLGYRWPVRVSILTATAAAVAGLRVEAAVLGAGGQVVRQVKGGAAGADLQVTLDGRGLPPGDYRLRLTVWSAEGRRLREQERPLAVLPPASNEVVCSPEGYTLVNGQRFFPIGLYWVLADPAGWKPGPGRKTDDLRELAAAGFNTLHTYAFEHNDANDTDDNAVAYLDMAQELGFKVMMGVRRDWYQGKELNAAAIERRVRRLREHPALLCWTLWDEPDSDADNAPRVQAVYDLVDRLDPYHPAMPVFMSGGGRPFREAADVNLFDCYPGAGNAGVLPGVFARARQAIPDKPLWYVAQAYQQGDKLPSEQDMRRYWQLALEGDARAIFWYCYGGDAKGWDSIRITPEHFASVKRVVGELADKVGAR